MVGDRGKEHDETGEQKRKKTALMLKRKRMSCNDDSENTCNEALIYPICRFQRPPNQKGMPIMTQCD